jgi:mono/diheme cytochrome c family protein
LKTGTAIAAIAGAFLAGVLAGYLALAARNRELQTQLRQAQADRRAALAKAAGNALEMENLRQDSLALARLREQLKTNAPSLDSPGGFFTGPDNSVYIQYGANDPVLQSFLRWVMNGGGDAASKGRAIFLKICAACHQRDGAGKDGVAPPLAGSEWVRASGGQRLVRIVLNGLNGPIEVQGRTWNLVMPPWRDNLDDEQIAVVLNFIRSQWGGPSPAAIRPELAAAARQPSHPGPETSAELLKVSPQ